jgi:hypothetical protein
LFVLAYGAARFLKSGFLPATLALGGDFGAVFPSSFFARLRPDFPSDAVWVGGWYSGPMVHFLTLPLFLVPRWSMVPTVWALTNVAALSLSFVFVCRLSGVAPRISWAVVAALAGLWLLFQPLVNCLAQGNIEIVEMALVLGALVRLQASKDRLAGALLGVAAMLKFLPIGFLGWLLLRQRWRAVGAGVAAIAVIAAITTVTLGWRESTLASVMVSRDASDSRRLLDESAGWNNAGLHELSVNSMFIHRAGVLDYDVPMIRWLPSERATLAARAGTLASLLLAAGMGLILFVRRRRPVSPLEISVLFMTMFMIVPRNHDYYYVFALVPLSVLFLKAAAARDWTLAAITIAAYVLISPPIPYAWIDRTGWFRLPFAYVTNFHDVPVLGGLILWFAATHQLLIEPGEEHAPPERRRSARRVLIVSIPAIILAALALVWVGRTGRAANSTSVTLSLQPSLQLDGRPALALSRDGSRVAYTTSKGVLCARALDQPAGTCWPDIVEASGPFFSPDGRWIGFFVAGAMKRVPVAGGAAEALDISEVSGGRTASWDYNPALPTLGRDGSILFASPSGICRMVPGGRPEVVVPSRPEDGPYFWPTMLPSGETVLFTVAPREGGPGAGAIVAQSLKTGRRETLLLGSQPHFDRQTGRLIYTVGGRVLAVAFDPDTLALSGVAAPLVGNVLVTVDGGALFALNDHGTLIYMPGSATPAVARKLLWVDRQGSAVPLPIPANAFETPRLSPDGRSVAATIREAIADLWTFDLATGAPARLTSAGPSSSTPAWTPDGRAVSFAVDGQSVWSAPIGAADRKPVPLWGGAIRLGGWSRDGRVLAGTQGGHLWLLHMTNDGPPRAEGATAPALRPPWSQAVVIETPFTERTPVFSPDGRWIAFSSNRSGSSDIYVRPFPELSDPQRVTVDGAAVEPVWSSDGREIFYRRHDALMAVSVTAGSTFTAGPSRTLFEGKFATTAVAARNYDVSPDGQHFVMVSREPEPDVVAREIRVLRNWSAKLPQ